MATTIWIGSALVLAVLTLVPVAIYYGSDMRKRRLVPAFADAQTPATASVPLPLAQVRARLEEKFSADGAAFKAWEPLAQPAYGPPFAQYEVATNETGSIDGQFRSTGDGGFSSDAPISTREVDLDTQDPGLPTYLQLPPPHASAIC